MDLVPANASTTERAVFVQFPNGTASISGRIDSIGDRDWYRIYLDALETYTFELQQQFVLRATVLLRDAAGAIVDEWSGRFGPIRSELDVNTSGEYFLDVGSLGGTRGAFTVTVAEPRFDFMTAPLLNVERSGVLQSREDREIFRLPPVDAENWLELVLFAPPTLHLTVIYSDGSELRAVSTGTPKYGRFSVERQAAVPEYVVVEGTAAGAFRLFGRDADILDDVTTNRVVEVNTEARGHVEDWFDSDFWGVQLNADEEYIIDASRVIGLRNLDLALRDRSGALLAFDAISGQNRNPLLTFTPSKTDLYFIDVQHNARGIGEYRFSVQSEIPGNVTTQAVAIVGGSYVGSIERDFDSDYWKTQLTAGQKYVVLGDRLQGLRNLDIAVRDSSGKLLAFDADSGPNRNPFLEFTAPTDGTYFIDIQHNARSLGAYSFSIVGDVPDSADEAVRVSGPLHIGEELDFLGDVDYFKFDIATGEAFVVRSLAGTRDVTLRILETSGREVFRMFADGFGRVWDPSAPGEYIAEVSGFRQIGTYDFGFTPDVGNNFNTSAGIVAGSSVRGDLFSRFDSDGYRLQVAAGETYTISLTSTGKGFFVQDASGRLLGNSEGRQFNPTSSFTAVADGEVLIFVSGAGRFLASGGSFDLAVRSDDAGDTFASARPTVVGTRFRGELSSPEDRDFFAVTLEAGETYRLALRGEDSNAGTLVDPSLKIWRGSFRNPDLVAANDDAGKGQDAFLLFTPNATGTYVVEATSPGGLGTGTYLLDVLIA